jgi:Xaa-Pro aminopeptidase
VLVITAERALLVTDFRYFEQVKLQAPDFELYQAPNTLVQALAKLAGELGLARIGFESDDLTVAAMERWRVEMPGVTWVPTSGLVEKLRRIKDATELAAMEEAVRLADASMAHIMEWIRPGMTERQVAWELELHMRTHGAEKLSFGAIVGFGANGAMSHAVPSDRILQWGDPVVIDMGCVVRGYCSDLTRSFCVGQADERYLSIWNTVLEAQLAVERQAKAGMTGVEIDAIARRIIYSAGHEGRFEHGLGHSVGLAIHEDPRASRLWPEALPAGCILTVEPGIYYPGWGGVRIEDMVVVGEDGCRVLTAVEKKPVVPGK